MSFKISKEELYDLYINKNYSAVELGKMFGLSPSGVKHWINKYNIRKNREKVVEKIKDTNLKKYGVEFVSQVEEVKAKVRQTNLRRYGVEYGLKSEKIKEKSKQTCLKKYGVDNPAKSSIIKKKMQATSLKKYGVTNPGGLPEFVEKARNTMQEKFGAKATVYSEELRNKMINTNKKKYGVPYSCMTEKCRTANGVTISKSNKNISEILNSNGIKNKLEKNINKYSYDIEILDSNILLEINPTYTHNSTDGGWFNNHKKEPLDKNYHKNKTLNAKENGYRCIHIWDWDNVDKIVEMLKPKEKIYARGCEIYNVSEKECNEFLNKNHLQGTCKGQEIRLGLYWLGDLIEIMTFGKPRYNKNYEYELIRLCSHNNYYIVGGTEKLFNYFLKEYQPKNIISYCDNSKFDGNVYTRLNFKLKDYGKPSKHWYNIKTKQHITDNLLRQRGFDQLFKTNYGKGTSNRELMIQNGFVEVYDSGQSTYVYEK